MNVALTYEGVPQRYTGAYVTDEFLKILGVTPILGRDFTAADNASAFARFCAPESSNVCTDAGASPSPVERSVPKIEDVIPPNESRMP